MSTLDSTDKTQHSNISFICPMFVRGITMHNNHFVIRTNKGWRDFRYEMTDGWIERLAYQLRLDEDMGESLTLVRRMRTKRFVPANAKVYEFKPIGAKRASWGIMTIDIGFGYAITFRVHHKQLNVCRSSVLDMFGEKNIQVFDY